MKLCVHPPAVWTIIYSTPVFFRTISYSRRCSANRVLWILETNAVSVSAGESSLKSHLVGIAHPWKNIVLPDRTQINATQIFVSWFHDSLKGFKIIICVSRIETRTLWQLFLVIFLSASIKRRYLSKVRVRNIGNTRATCLYVKKGLVVG